MNIPDKFLPIGTIILLKGGKKRIMIIGYAPVAKDATDKIYDYAGCMFPAGVMSTEETLVFDHDQIEKMYALGFQDEEGKKFTEDVKKVMTPENIQKMLELIKNKG